MACTQSSAVEVTRVAKFPAWARYVFDQGFTPLLIYSRLENMTRERRTHGLQGRAYRINNDQLEELRA